MFYCLTNMNVYSFICVWRDDIHFIKLNTPEKGETTLEKGFLEKGHKCTIGEHS